VCQERAVCPFAIQFIVFEIRIICGVIPGRGLLPASPESIIPVFPCQSHQWLWIPGSPRKSAAPRNDAAGYEASESPHLRAFQSCRCVGWKIAGGGISTCAIFRGAILPTRSQRPATRTQQGTAWASRLDALILQYTSVQARCPPLLLSIEIPGVRWWL